MIRGLAAMLLALLALPGAAQQARPEQAERISFPTISCFGTPWTCHRLAVHGFLFAKPGQDKVVMISHGSQGIDSRMYDYVDQLQKDGFAALVIDHWTPRGITVTHDDYVAASDKGGSVFSISADGLAAAAWLRARGFARVGSIGESQGGAAAINLQQKWVHALVERNMKRLHGPDFQLKPVDVVVSLYAYCGVRHASRDAYFPTPFLFVTGAEDNETPSRYCERYASWMNERGGNAKIVVLPGEGHSFDAPYKRQRSFGPHYAKCDILVDDKGVTELNSGMQAAGSDVQAMMARCLARGYHTGHWKDRFVGVPHWSAFFREHL